MRGTDTHGTDVLVSSSFRRYLKSTPNRCLFQEKHTEMEGHEGGRRRVSRSDGDGDGDGVGGAFAHSRPPGPVPDRRSAS